MVCFSESCIGWGASKILRLVAGLALVTAAVSPSTAWAQDPGTQGSGTQVIDGTIITLGGGAQLLSLPDMKFSFVTGDNSNTTHKQTNSNLDDYGGAFVGSVETPFGYWGGTPVAGVVSGFFANVEGDDTKRCVNSGGGCFVENLVDNPDKLDSVGYERFKTKTSRDVDYWGVGAEARFGKGPAPVPDAGGYLFRLGYVGIGTDVRGIDQDNRLRLRGDGPAVNYGETLDTTYWGGFLSIGGEYNVLGYLGMGGSWGLRSLVSLRAGVYDANTDYSGRFNTDGATTSRLGLSDDKVAFIGAARFETRKQFGPRTSLSLVTDYEYYSSAPEMRYVDTDTIPGHTYQGKVNKTGIGGGGALEVRTTLRLNIALGPAPLYTEPLK
jgi:hypothetical protein